MEIKSWYEELREEFEERNTEAARQEAIAEEAKWRAEDGRPHNAADVMHCYANLMMEEELKALGNYVIQLCPQIEDRWMISDVVFRHYGRYCMFARKPKEAAEWFEKALEYDQESELFFVWQDLAAAYIESGEYEKADYWIQRYLNYLAKNDLLNNYERIEFANFYVKAKNYERAAALLLEIPPGDKWQLEDKLTLARAFFGLGEFEKGRDIYEAYLLKWNDDEVVFAELALAYYEHCVDLERSEANYLKSAESAKKRKDARNWNQQIYKNLSILFANEGVWDKCFHYLKLHYRHKYEGGEAEIFCQMIDSMPPIENDEMGAELFQLVLAFEESPIRASLHGQAATDASENPADEVKGVEKNAGDISNLIDWDDAMQN